MLFNVKSAYSLLHSTVTIDEYINSAKRYGYQSIGLADVNVLHGVYEFYKKTQQAEMKPLIGMTLQLPGMYHTEAIQHYLIYALNYEGYLALIELSYLTSKKPLPIEKIWQSIHSNNEYLVMIIADRRHEFFQAIFREQYQQAHKLLSFYQNHLTQNPYIGVSIYPLNKVELSYLNEFAKENALTLVIGQPVEMLESTDAFSLQVLKAIDDHETHLERSLMDSKGVNYLYRFDDLKSMYIQAGLEDIVKNTQLLTEKIQVTFPDTELLFPSYQTDSGQSSDEMLEELTMNALHKKSLAPEPAYVERLNHELSIITEMGFSDYFLIVWDIIAYCRQNHIQLGSGRGSAPGSLVAYLLEITSVDPIYYDLLFERFLNPERYTMPDIDIDIPDIKRGQVLNYVKEKYGYHQVAQIITFGTFGAKQSIRDTLRVLGADSEELKLWSNSIPTDQNQLMTLERAYNESDELRQIVQSNPENQELFKVALKIEGLPRHTSTHAAAVVIYDQPLKNIIPILDNQDNLLLTQFTMYDVEEIGLLKMDFLGLRNLTILDNILKRLDDDGISLDIENIPKDDQQTIKIFQQAETNGVFQFESPGIKRVLVRLKPERFEDIVAVNALYRPGPMQQIDHFIKRRHGQEAIDYIVPELEPILSKTYGIIVYQEQVMQILVQMGGFSFGQADVLRRAMSKKQAHIMEEQRVRFIEGAKERGFEESVAHQVYDYIYAFSNYGFNRAHAVAYSTLAYQLAYLKAHYPLYFYQAIINSGSSQNTSYISMINEAKRRLSKDLLGIDVNESDVNFTIENQQLRVGLSAIKGIRKELMMHLIDDRQLIGPYKDYFNFLQRLPKKFLNKETIVPIIAVGALDGLGYSRATLMHNLETLIQSVEYSGANISLFKELEPRIEPIEEYDLMEKIQLEREYLGFALSGHPMDHFIPIIQQHNQLMLIEELSEVTNNRTIETIGLIEAIKIIQTKKGDDMAFVTLSDEFYQIEGVIFPQVFNRSQSLLNQYQIVHVKGKKSTNKRGNQQIIINHMSDARNLMQQTTLNAPEYCYIKVNNFPKAVRAIEKLKELAKMHPGPTVIILVDSNYRTIQLNAEYNISYSQHIQSKVRDIFSNSQVIFQ
ncbi:DNA polymerase III subunit alpha [Aerococcaceae bacterium DSM 111020]|nr:DNA polymerase III subunit alpha [Aerococcaceae bacterium DSM 111020]